MSERKVLKVETKAGLVAELSRIREGFCTSHRTMHGLAASPGVYKMLGLIPIDSSLRIGDELAVRVTEVPYLADGYAELSYSEGSTR